MDNFEKVIKILSPLGLVKDENLSAHTYFKIGGRAKLFLEAKTLEGLKEAIITAKKFDVPFVVIGGGANILVSDNGFAGLVIQNRAELIKLIGIKGTITKGGRGIKSAHVWAASGTLMNKLARFTIDQGLEGLEFLLSVPGTVGGGIKINSHYEVEKNEFIGNFLESATLFDPQTQQVKKVDHDYFDFSYDQSKIQQTTEIVLDAIFKLNVSADPKSRMEKAITDVKRRNEEQPIGIACSGCVFRNIDPQEALRLNTPNHTTSTGYIIESLGLKGTKIGGAEISQKHANYIINTGNAKAADVLKLIELVKFKAREKYNLELKEEIFKIGDF